MNALYAQSQKSLKCWRSSWLDCRTSNWYGRWGGRDGVAGVSLGASTLSICRWDDRLEQLIHHRVKTAEWKGETLFLYLTVQQVDERFHFSDHLHQLGQWRVVVLLWNLVQPLKVVLIQLQVSMQLRECGLQLETTQTYFRDLTWVWRDVTVRIETDQPLSLHKHAHTHTSHTNALSEHYLKIVEITGWSVAHFWQRPEPVGLHIWIKCMLPLKEKTRHKAAS